MCKCLGVVAKRIAGARVDLLRVQSEIIRIAQQLFKFRTAVLHRAASECQILRFPEAANPERAFCRLPLVAVQQPWPSAQPCINCGVGPLHSFTTGALKSIPTEEEQACVKLMAAKRANVRSQV